MMKEKRGFKISFIHSFVHNYTPFMIIKAARRLIRYNLRSLLIFTIVYKIVTMLMLAPLMSTGFNYVLKRSGYSYLTPGNIRPILNNPMTISLIVVFLLIILLVVAIEVSSYIICFQYSRDQKKISPWHILYHGGGNAFRLFQLHKLEYFLYLLVMIPVSNLLFIILLLNWDNVPNYLVNTVVHTRYFYHVVLVGSFCIVFFTIFLLFVSHYCMGEHKPFRASVRYSMLLLRKRKLRTAWYLLVWNVLLIGILLATYFAVLILLAITVLLFVKDSVVVVYYIALLRKVNLFFLLLVGLFGVVLNVALVSAIFYRYKMETGEDVRIGELKSRNYRVKKNATRRVFSIVIMLVMLVNAAYLYNSIYNGVFGVEDALAPIQITSHRGNSISAPENTMEALKSAVAEFADFAEIDVQETKDGEVVLLHDPNLKRTTGLNRFIWEVPFAEVEQLDAGSWFSDEFVGVRIPTLDEVLEYCKGKINLNIEIKINGHEQDIERKVVSLIEKHGFERQCVVTSMSYESLVSVKKMNNELKTGLIMSIVYGNFYDKLSIDFYSMKSSFITQRVVKEAHSRGKEIHAWTVNTKNEMDRLKNMGVDNIITDKPVKAREVLYRKIGAKSVQDLMTKIIKQ